MRVLVIGGSGTFIGARVLGELVRSGHEVAAFSRTPAPGRHDVRHFAGDRRQLSDAAPALRAFAPEVVVDVILSSERQARELVDTFRGVASRLVALSSMDVYRSCAVLHRIEPGPLEPVPLTEQSPLRTIAETYPPAQTAALQQIFSWLDDEYDKTAVERALRADPGLPATILRLPMVYGPGDKLHRFFPVLKRMDDGRRAILFTEDFAAWRATKGFVDNVAAAIALAAASERAAGRTYNVGESDALSELEWAHAIARATGWNGEFVVLPFERAPASLQVPANFRQHWAADTSRLRDELGFREAVTRDEAIRRTIEWERGHPPPQSDPRQFDYAAEDAVLALSGRGT